MKPGNQLEADPAIEKAAQYITAGQVVAVPTETVYGLAGDATDPSAINRIFAAKNRPSDNPLIVHLSNLDMVHRYCLEVDPRVAILAEAFWPGPLTMVLKAGKVLRETVCRGLDTVAVRIPDHPVIQALITRVDRGLAAPSANLSGKPSPTTAKAVLYDLQGRIPLILDGGPCRVGLESTVLDMSGDEPVILRPGLVTPGPLSEVLGSEIRYVTDDEARRRSPGTRYRHYSPDARVLLLAPDVTDSCRMTLLEFLKARDKTGYIGSRVTPPAEVHYDRQTPKTLPANLYSSLRAMDNAQINAVVVDGVAIDDQGLGLMDRLIKAASCYFHNDSEAETWMEAPSSPD